MSTLILDISTGKLPEQRAFDPQREAPSAATTAAPHAEAPAASAPERRGAAGSGKAAAKRGRR